MSTQKIGDAVGATSGGGLKATVNPPPRPKVQVAIVSSSTSTGHGQIFPQGRS